MTVIARVRRRARSAVRGGWSAWAPWMAAAVVFIVAIEAGQEVYDFEAVEGGLRPIVAATTAIPVGLIISRPLVGWLIASVSAFVYWQAFPIVDGDPWSMTPIHGLIILTLLLVIVWSPSPTASDTDHPAVRVIVWAGTAAVFGMLTASDIRVGWIVAVSGVAAAGLALRFLGIRQKPRPDVGGGRGQADWKTGFLEAFSGLPESPTIGTALSERYLGNRVRLKQVLALSPWVLGIGMFVLALTDIEDKFEIHSLALPVAAALVALPIALIGDRALIGWRIIVLTAIAFALVGMPLRDGYLWPSALEGSWAIVTFVVSIRHDRPTVVWVWLTNVAVMSAGYAGLADDTTGATTGQIAAMTVLVFIGDLIRSWRRAAESLEEQTELSELEKARRTVLEERTRIARDLHDVVAHHMSMVVVQAESAPFRLDDLSDETKVEFESISTSARQALGEIRGLLGVLRSESDAARYAPQPGIDELRALIDGARRSGVNVSMSVTGDGRELPAVTELSAYRIVQESLANAARHAPGTDVSVTVEFNDASLDLRVTNSAPNISAGPSSGGWDGHGIVGMRERATVAGGTLRAAPLPDGGFEVTASLPVGGLGVGGKNVQETGGAGRGGGNGEVGGNESGGGWE